MFFAYLSNWLILIFWCDFLIVIGVDNYSKGSCVYTLEMHLVFMGKQYCLALVWCCLRRAVKGGTSVDFPWAFVAA